MDLRNKQIIRCFECTEVFPREREVDLRTSVFAIPDPEKVFPREREVDLSPMEEQKQ